jgi:hypothetical protein
MPADDDNQSGAVMLRDARAALLRQLIIVKLWVLSGLRPLLAGLGRLLWGLLERAGRVALAALLAALIFLLGHNAPRSLSLLQRKTSGNRFMFQMLFVNLQRGNTEGQP